MDEETMERLAKSKILMVGAGGIGCELLKNLVLSEFGNIDVIDLDTIELSNLNRQFLFQRQHVGKSKAEVAVESVQAFNGISKLKSYHASIMDPSFDVNFFKQYDLILNALDNRAARNHVNRICLAADVPLIESGSAGFLGQVTLIKKGITECYECQPKGVQKTYPGCTIRNTPSEPIHCIVWAKHLFNQLFGAADPDEDVSPDMSDPELQETNQATTNGGNGAESEKSEINNTDEAAKETSANVERMSTRKWAIDHGYDAQKLFTKLFHDDIEYLLSMANLWKKRTPPEPISWQSIPDDKIVIENSSSAFDQRVWTIPECRKIFADCVAALTDRVALEKKDLVWDKDDDACINFVTACANIRAHCFHIPMKSRFDVKSMAGNIIPAIATTNAIVAGLIVVEAIKVLTDRTNECKTIFIVKDPSRMKKLLGTEPLVPPNPICYVCSSKPEVTVKLNLATFTVQSLAEKVLKQRLNMVAPDVEVDDNTGRIIISSEEEETSALQHKTLSELNIQDGTRLKCDDFLQHFELRLIIQNSSDLPQEHEFEIISDTSQIKAKPIEAMNAAAASQDDEDDLLILEDESPTRSSKKRKADDDLDVEEIENGTESKRSKVY